MKNMVENNKISVNLMRTSATWRAARIAIFTALSVIGSFIKPPSPIPSVAFDSAAGFFVALYFGAFEGAVVSGIGHIATAAVSGFPYGILHIPIALGMALAGGAIGIVNRMSKKWGFIPAIIVGVIINTALVFPIAPWIGGWLVALGLVPFLLLAASLNAIVAALVYVALRGKLRV